MNTIPQTGFLRVRDLVGDPKANVRGLLPISKATLWRRVKEGSYPAPVKLSNNVTAWPAQSIRALIERLESSAAAND